MKKEDIEKLKAWQTIDRKVPAAVNKLRGDATKENAEESVAALNALMEHNGVPFRFSVTDKASGKTDKQKDK